MKKILIAALMVFALTAPAMARPLTNDDWKKLKALGFRQTSSAMTKVQQNKPAVEAITKILDSELADSAKSSKISDIVLAVSLDVAIDPYVLLA